MADNKGYRQIYIYDEFDKYISQSHGLTVIEFIHLVENVMSEKDATDFIEYTLQEELEQAKAILRNYNSNFK